MSVHDKDPEIRFVTAIYTYISYFVLIMVRCSHHWKWSVGDLLIHFVLSFFL